MCAQRFKAIDYVAIRGGHWQHAQFQELLTPENRSSISTPADLMTVNEERKQASKLYPEPVSESYWKGSGKGTFLISYVGEWTSAEQLTLAVCSRAITR